MKKYAVYIIRTADNYLYTGITSDLDRRYQEHMNGIKRCLKYKKRPFNISYVEYFKSLKEAAKREKEIKGWRREKKENIIRKLALSSRATKS